MDVHNLFQDIISFMLSVDLFLWVNLSIVLAVAVAYRFIWNHFAEKARKTSSFLDKAFINAIHHPFYVLLLLVAGKIISGYISSDEATLFDHIPIDMGDIFSLGFTVFIVVVVNKFLGNIQKEIIHLEKNHVVENSGAWVSACKLGRLGSVLIFILAVCSILNVPMAQIAAPTAVGALALSFASKDVLSNMFGGFVVMCDRPFTVGDYVQIGSQDEGTVRYIGWRMTQIQLRNGRILHVPNGMVTTSPVTNYSEKTHWFVQKDIGLRYQDLHLASEIAKDIEEWVEKHMLTNRRQVSFANLYDFGDSSVNIRVRVYLKNTITTKQWYSFTEEMLLYITKLVEGKGADFAFPTTTVIMDESEEKI